MRLTVSPQTTDSHPPNHLLPVAGGPRRKPTAQHHLLLQDGLVQAMPLDGSDGSDGSPPSTWPAWCAAHPGARVRLLLGARLLLAVPLNPVPLKLGLPQRGAAAWRQEALARWVPLHGQHATHWPLALWCSAAGRGVLALLPLVDAQADPAPAHPPSLWATAALHGVQLLAVQPAWWWAVQAAVQRHAGLRQAGHALLWLAEPGAATAVALRHGVARAVLLRRQVVEGAQGVDSGEDAAAACQALGLPADALQHQAALWPLAQAVWPAPAWRSALAPDFAGPPRPRRLAWAALAVASTTLLLAGVDTQHAWQTQQDAADRLAAVDGAAQRAGPPTGTTTPSATPSANTTTGSPTSTSTARNSTPSASTASASTASADAAEADLAAAQAALARPWGAVLAATEAASLPGTQWSQLEQTGTRLRLEGLAPDLDRALLAAVRLGRHPGLRQVVLARLQQPANADPAPAGAVDTPPSQASAQQFELQAQWPNTPPAPP